MANMNEDARLPSQQPMADFDEFDACYDAFLASTGRALLSQRDVAIAMWKAARNMYRDELGLLQRENADLARELADQQRRKVANDSNDSTTLTLPMRAAGICAAELLTALDATYVLGMPLNVHSVRRCADKVIERVALHDEKSAVRQALLILAATTLLVMASADAEDVEDGGDA